TDIATIGEAFQSEIVQGMKVADAYAVYGLLRHDVFALMHDACRFILAAIAGIAAISEAKESAEQSAATTKQASKRALAEQHRLQAGINQRACQIAHGVGDAHGAIQQASKADG